MRSLGKAKFDMDAIINSYRQVQSNPVQQRPIVPKPQPRSVQRPVQKNQRKTSQAKKQSKISRVSNNMKLDLPPAPKLVKTLKPQVEICQAKCKQINQGVFVYGQPIRVPELPKEGQLPLSPGSLIQFGQCRQGQTGNCYFISAYHSLLSRSHSKVHPLLKNISPSTKIQDRTYVMLFESGFPCVFLLEPFFEPRAARPIDGDVTALFLQKAYATLYGGYQNLNMGRNQQAFQDLTGAPSFHLDLNLSDSVAQLKQAFKEKFLLTLSSKSGVLDEPLKGSHSYSILEVSEEGKLCLIKVKDPNGGVRQAPRSKAYDLNREQLLRKGIFWLDFESLRKNFQVITVCRLRDNFISTCKAISLRQLRQQPLVKLLRVERPTLLSVSFYQRHKRNFISFRQYRYQIASLALVQFNQSVQGKTIDSTFTNKQSVSIEAHLPQGAYLLILTLKVVSPYLPDDIAAALNVYSEHAVHLLDMKMEPQARRSLQENAICNFLQTNDLSKPHHYKHDIVRYYGSCMGSICLLYINNGTKTLSQEIIPDRIEGVEGSRTSVEVRPGERRLLRMSILNEGALSHRFSFKSNTIIR